MSSDWKLAAASSSAILRALARVVYASFAFAKPHPGPKKIREGCARLVPPSLDLFGLRSSLVAGVPPVRLRARAPGG